MFSHNWLHKRSDLLQHGDSLFLVRPALEMCIAYYIAVLARCKLLFIVFLAIDIGPRHPEREIGSFREDR